MNSAFPTTEASLSQTPALQLLANVGYIPLTPRQARAERGGRADAILLEPILRAQLAKLNRIRYQDGEYAFSDANIQEAIRKLKSVTHGGLRKANRILYDHLTLGVSLEQTIGGDRRSFTLRYIDWRDWRNNAFHVTTEFAVRSARSDQIIRPDIVLFVNGIPLCVIECKAPRENIEQAISQMIRNQLPDYIPHLFAYTQMVVAINKNAARYATVGTSAKFWSVWREMEDTEEQVAKAVQPPKDTNTPAPRLVTEQDRALYSLCRPERLLELAHGYTLFENEDKKIARYQQFFVVRQALARLRRRESGIIWHTQGSGKSLTMVMLARRLARGLAFDSSIANPRIVLVTDRIDLDTQLANTFNACGLTSKRATSGRKLIQHLRDGVAIVTTLIHKFDQSQGAERYTDTSSDIIMLVDESHRTNFGSLAAQMRKMLPNAAYLGFTGTPLLKNEKNNFATFGPLIEPHYSIRRAVEDKAVVPLLYEGRHVEISQNREAMDLWFARHTKGLTQRQQADLRSKFARAKVLNSADPVIYMRSFDISEHYRTTLQGTGFKAQLVAPSKAAAVKYHACLQSIGDVASAIIISPPDTREGHETVAPEPSDKVLKFWATMMERYGSEQDYVRRIVDQFKHGEKPEILIVVDKLLTGFDAPVNTVLYLCRPLREHTLLQAIARVNRLHENKEHGHIVDYDHVLKELDQALNHYDALAGYDADDIADTLASARAVVDTLPQKHSQLWDIFRGIKNRGDEESHERLLADEQIRANFYARLTAYGKVLTISLSTAAFITETSEAKLAQYKNDLARLTNLKRAVKHRYAEAVDYRDYDPKIKKLLDTHIQADQVTRLNEPVNILNQTAVGATIAQGNAMAQGNATPQSAAATATQKGATTPQKATTPQSAAATKQSATTAPIATTIAQGNTIAEGASASSSAAPSPSASALSAAYSTSDTPAPSASAPSLYSPPNRTTAAHADRIAYTTKKTITEQMGKDPAFYEKFSLLIQQVIDDFRAQRISDADYLQHARRIKKQANARQRTDIPPRIRANPEASAYYGVCHKLIKERYAIPIAPETLCDLALTIQTAIETERKVDYWHDDQALNRTKAHIDEFFYGILQTRHGITLTPEQMDEIIKTTLQIAKNRQE